MLIQFLGTNAGSPNIKRNVSSIALIFKKTSDVWLFDCGESTQNQILHTSIKLNKIKKIFITHMHGDHIFGLPGLLTSRSIHSSQCSLEIYGCKGIKSYIEMSLRMSNSYINFPLDIIEIKEGEIFTNDEFKVTSIFLNHTLECYGYKVNEFDKLGHLNVVKLISDGIYPGPIYKNLKLGKKVNLNDGTIVNGADYLGPSIKGKSIVILGDTSPLNDLCNEIFFVDVLIHESTLDYSLEFKANSRGHSTNVQAAIFAKNHKVKKLIITHFSSRYRNNGLNKILNECIYFFPNTKLAKDFSIFEV